MGFRDMMESARLKRDLRQEQVRNQLARTRANTAALEMQADAIERYKNSGYSNGGASKTATWAEKYHSRSLSAKSDIEENRKTLRERTRDLTMNAPLATAAVVSTRTNCVGSGLMPKPKINYGLLGITKEEAEELQTKIKNEFALWAESTICDAADQNNFYELQQIAFLDWLKNGEEFALLRYGEKLSYMPYQLRIKLVEADRICTEGSFGEYDGYDKKLKNGNIVMNGIEINPGGKVVAYHICSVHPGECTTKSLEWTRVEKRGKTTGNPNVLHIFNAERAEQYRGVPFLAPVIETIKQLSRYTEAEIMAALLNAMLAIFITNRSGTEGGKFVGVERDSDRGDEDGKVRIGAGTVTYLADGEDVKPVESKHPSGNYDAFVQAMSVQIGAALEIAPEILLKKFGQSFSASKGALNETWKAYSMRRKWFINDFCQEVYNLWFAEAVSKGRIDAPGFFQDPIIQKAYTRATWNGPAQGNLDPVKEVVASEKRIENGLSTREDECAIINGSDYEDNVRTLIGENEKLAEANRKGGEQ